MRWFDDQYFAVRGLVYTLSISCESCYCGSSSYIQEVLWRCLNDCRRTLAMILECPGVSCWTKCRPRKASLWSRQQHSWPSITLSLRRVFRRDHPPLKLAIRDTTERGAAVPSVHEISRVICNHLFIISRNWKFSTKNISYPSCLPCFSMICFFLVLLPLPLI